MDIWFTLFVMLAAVMVAVGGALLLVSYLLIVPASFNFGWKQWVPTLLLPVIGPLWFVRQHRPEFNRAEKQMIIAVVLLALVALMLLIWGPYFVERALANARIPEF